MAGRFAPSPSGTLHIGNLRTAWIAWLSARADGVPFLVRMDDLDPLTSADRHGAAQLADLSALGIEWDGAVVHQRDRFDRYHEAIAELVGRGLTYPCFCSRREIREAAAAPHGSTPDGAYPGTCRDLTATQRDHLARARRPALRLLAGGAVRVVHDEIVGNVRGVVDDFVIRRNDGVPAYNLAVVLDDWDQGVSQVVRGDDLLFTTPRHLVLQELLGAPVPRYLHVPLVVGPNGDRLAKRDGAVTLAELAHAGVDARQIRRALWMSVGLGSGDEELDDGVLVDRFSKMNPCDLAGSRVALADLVRTWEEEN